MAEESFQWLKSLPLAPTFHPTLTEFQDPIAYIYKIEEQASKYGICKIIPPVSVSSKKTAIENLNRTLSSLNPDSSPTFTTRHQQVGFCARKLQSPVQRPVWESGNRYTLSQFEQKAKKFQTNQLKKVSNLKRELTEMEIEMLYWKAQIDQAINVECGNDLPGSVFGNGKQGISDVLTVGDSEWNMRNVARANGSLLKFLKEEMPGVTSPMIYICMLFYWFGWHVEDHEFHSMNYLHMGAPKTWYGVPGDAAFAFEDVMRVHAFGGDISPIVTLATLVGKTTIVSPEVLVKYGVPCCRLVQNAGEFVVTFPRAYHCGFSHGFNFAEAVNIATPGWLKVAREAVIRRVSIDSAPMVSDSQMLYDLAMSLCSSKYKCSRPEPQSSRLRDKVKLEGDTFVKQEFMEDVMHNNKLLNALRKGSPVTILSEHALRSLVSYGVNLNANKGVDKRPRKKLYSSSGQINKNVDPTSIFSCVTCGSPCYACVAIVKPSETAAQYLMSNDDVNVTNLGLSSGSSQSNIGGPKDNSTLNVLPLLKGDSSNQPMNSTCEKESSRMHAFCLEHASEVEQRLRPVGGVYTLLLCHQDYRKINDAARSVSKEMGISDDKWTDVRFIDVSERSYKAMVQWFLDEEETATCKQDWAVKLGMNIFYSAKLGGTQFYRKQMPYNSVIYKAFGQCSSSNEEITPKQLGKQKKNFVAGKWCGKVWMSNQVHSLLAVRYNDDTQEDEKHDDQEAVSLVPKMNAKQLAHREMMQAIKEDQRQRMIAIRADEKREKCKKKAVEVSPRNSALNTTFTRQTTRNVVDRDARICDVSISTVDSEDTLSDSPDTIRFKSRKSSKATKRKCKTTEKLEVGIKPKMVKAENQIKRYEKVLVDSGDDEEGAFSGEHNYILQPRPGVKQNLSGHGIEPNI